MAQTALPVAFHLVADSTMLISSGCQVVGYFSTHS